MLYNVILFLHIIGTILMFVAIGITLTAMISIIHSKKVETMQIWAKLAVEMDGLLPFSVIFILLPGLYLVITTWGWGQAWVNLSLLTLIIMTVMGPAINLRRLKNILKAVEAEVGKTSVPSPALMNLAKDRTLWNSVSIMSMLAIGIVLLMTVKIGLFGSIAAIVLAILAGFGVANILLNFGAGVKIANPERSAS
ncbi:hypothetical protein L1279_000545 [Planomicrobium sp. HSC-17F08]|nr:hypothetical protein [Planomicrobium sp. HSC-17F08]